MPLKGSNTVSSVVYGGEAEEEEHFNLQLLRNDEWKILMTLFQS